MIYLNPRATHTHTRTHAHNKATSRKEKGKRKKNKDPITPNRFPPSRSTIHSLLFLPDLLVYFQHHCTFFFHPIYPLTYLGICSPSPPPHHTTHTYTPRPPIIGKPRQSPSSPPGVGVEGGVAVVAKRAEGHFTRIRSSVYIHVQVHTYIRTYNKKNKKKKQGYYYFET